MKNTKKENCPLCPNHCPADDLQCAKGRTYAKDGGKTTEHHHSHHEHFMSFRGEKRKHSKADLSKDSLPCLLIYSSRYLHKVLREGNIEDEKRLFSCLDEAEQNQLKVLLQKLHAYWS